MPAPYTAFTSGDPATAGPPLLYEWDGTSPAKVIYTGFTVGPNPVPPLGLPFIGEILLPNGVVGEPYDVEEECDPPGATTPITFSISSGSLPPGLSLTYAGNAWEISGTPTTAGTYGFVLEASNATGNTTRSLSITVDVISGATNYGFVA